MSNAVAPTSSAAYNSAVNQLQAVAEAFSTKDFITEWWRPTPLIVVLFLAYMSTFVAVNTLKVYLYGIRDFMLRMGLEDPTRNFFVELCWKGIKRSKRTKPDDRLTLTIDMLRKSGEHVQKFIRNGIPKSAAIHLLIACQTGSTWAIRGLLRIGEIFLSGPERLCRVLRNADVRESEVSGMPFIGVQ
eukprot:g24251.t1